MLRSLLTAAALVLAVPAVQAAGLPQLSDFSTVDAGISGGTLGVGPTIDFHTPGSGWGARLDADFMSVGLGFNRDGTKFSGNANAATGGVTGDWYPLDNGLRVSLGARINGNNVNVSGNPSFSAKIGNHTYNGSDVGTITGKATFNTFSPYVGIGYSHAVYGPLTASIDAGVMYEGTAHLSLSANGPLSSNAAFQQDLATESHSVRSYLNDAQFYPVLQISFTYRF
jgi:hypothetical protein